LKETSIKNFLEAMSFSFFEISLLAALIKNNKIIFKFCYIWLSNFFGKLTTKKNGNDVAKKLAIIYIN
jgi:hypothetical protein